MFIVRSVALGKHLKLYFFHFPCSLMIEDDVLQADVGRDTAIIYVN